jgi:hypothetical protein
LSVHTPAESCVSSTRFAQAYSHTLWLIIAVATPGFLALSMSLC